MDAQNKTDSARLQEIVDRMTAADSDVRRWAIYDLEDIKVPESVDILVRALQDEHRAVREAASEILESTDPALAVNRLIPLLENERIEVRNTCAAVLVKYGSAAVEGLIPALEDENEDIRKFSADILGLTRSENAVAPLCRRVLNDEVTNVAVSAVEALGKIGSPQAIQTLETIIRRGGGMEIESVEALGLIGSAESLELLLGLMGTDDPVLLYSVIDALGNLGAEQALPVLFNTAGQHMELLKETTCISILKIGHANQRDVLSELPVLLLDYIIMMLGSEKEEITDLVIEQIRLCRDTGVFRKWLEQRSSLPSTCLVALLRSLPVEPEFSREVCELTEHPDEWVAYTALECMGQFQDQLAESTVVNALHETHGLRLMGAVRAARRMHIKTARPRLEELTLADEPDLSHEATMALEAIQAV